MCFPLDTHTLLPEPFTVQLKCTPSHLILGPLVFEEAGLDHLPL